MHIADAVGTACVALFGPTDEKMTGPYGSRHALIRGGNCELSPCFERKCPLQKQSCFSAVDAEQLAGRMVEFLTTRDPD